MPDTFALSRHLLDQIATFSRRYLAEHLRLPPEGSPHGADLRLRPLGLVMHYCADPRLETVLRWFCDPRSQSSAHYVVAQGQVPGHAACAEGMPDIQAMPATIVQMRPLGLQAYHATWANRWALGVELCNAGELRANGRGELSPVAKVPYDPTHAPVLEAGERRFAGYSDAQLFATLVLCRSLAKVTGFAPQRLVGHDMVQGVHTRVRGAQGNDKRDVGGLRLDAWRRFVYGPPDIIPQSLRTPLRLEVPRSLWEARATARDGLAKRRLATLGYAVDPDIDAYSPAEGDALGMFQVMMGLVPDQICGPKTQAALLARVRDRFDTAQNLPVPTGGAHGG